MSKLRRLALPGRTVRLRFTILYAVLFLVSGIGLLALTNLLAGGQRVTEVAPGQNPPAQQSSLAAAQERIHQLEAQLSDIHAIQSRQLLIGSLIALVVMVAVSVLLGERRRRSGAAPAADDHRGDAADLRREPARAAGSAGPRR